MPDFLKIERGPTTTLTIARPDKMNALNAAVIAELDAVMVELARDTVIRALVVTGEGKAFVAGADISEMREMSPEAARSFSSAGQGAFQKIENAPFPVIAAVNGFALGGGCELSLACDFIVASEKAKFGQPEVKLGVIPGFGGTQRLLRRVGVAKARELVFTGAVIDAQEALRIGLVNSVVPEGELLTRANELATNIAAMGPYAVSVAKRVIREGEMRALAEANSLEATGFAECFTSPQQREGMSAFLEKRPAKF